MRPQAYLARFQEPGYHDSYPAFLANYTQVRGDLSGYMGLFTPAHLWFILFLFVFSLIGLPLFLALRREAWQRTVARLAAFAEGHTFVCLSLLLLPQIVAGALPDLGGQNPFFYFTVFALGFLLVSDGRFLAAVERRRRALAWPALVTMAAVLAVETTGFSPAKYSLGDITFYLLRTTNTWLWLLALLGYGRCYLNIDNGLRRYASQAAYPFYVLHQTVIVIIACSVVRWQAGVALRYTLIALASLALTVAIYDVLVKRIDLMRFLFGMKPLARPAAGEAAVGRPGTSGRLPAEEH